ncbi:MAG: DEAD/DEAH box helicase [Tetrasphaera sp.]
MPQLPHNPAGQSRAGSPDPEISDPATVAIALAGRHGAGRIRHVETIAARAADVVPLPEWLDPGLAMALHGVGIGQLWRHQRVAADLVMSGRHVVLATGTASGKSLGYLLPAITAVAAGSREPSGRGATVLYLAPTKALAADQATRIGSLLVPGVRPATYDGDTPSEERRWIRQHANVVLTNPDLVHHSMLARHAQWRPFLRALRYVVIDECHAYRGIFGSSVALVIRRLRRILQRYRANPVVVLASATVGDPAGHASALTGLPVTAVVEDGSPRGELGFVLWEPPLVMGGDGSLRRRSATSESANLLAGLVDSGVQTLAFARSRAGVEAVAAAAARQLGPRGAQTPVAAYRGGYLPEERRALEADLRVGRLRGLAATNALELGIDIHGLDAVVMAGWPGRIASVWQQAGRAGRGGGRAAAVLVGADDPLDGYVLDHPEILFGAPVEQTVINPGNPRLLAGHLCAAANEKPLTEADAEFFGPGMGAVIEELVAAGRLRRRPAGWFWPHDAAPDAGSLRGTDAVVAIVEQRSGRVVGTVDSNAAHVQVHPGAVHVHQGASFVVTDLDLDLAVATVTRGDPGWSTVAASQSTFELGEAAEMEQAGPVGVHRGAVRVHRGPVTVRTRVVSFQRRLPSGEVIGQHRLDLPERVLQTEGVWWTIDPDALAVAGVAAEQVPGAAHAAEHAAIGMLPLFATCDRWDIGGVSTECHPQTGLPTILIYDAFPGGAGYAAHGHRVAADWLAATRDAVAGCPCETGCPRCVHSPKCGNGNAPLDKAGAVALLELLARPTVR